jgi:mRNA-degrading endonuclease toxin of MazEF toxin-antitoxin module
MKKVTVALRDHLTMSVYAPIVTRQRLDKHVPAATKTPNNKTIGYVVFYAVRVVSKERRLGHLVLVGA